MPSKSESGDTASSIRFALNVEIGRRNAGGWNGVRRTLLRK
jgi:hypothetical protein